MNTSEEFAKKMKPSKITLIVGLIFIATGLVVELFLYMRMKEVKDNPIAIENLEKEGEYTCVDVHAMSDYFATYTGGSDPDKKYYFLADENYIYIANINEKTKDKLQSIFDYSMRDEDSDMEKPNPVTICGNSKGIESKLKELAIDYYNEGLEEKVLTYTNFDQYLGYYYIDTDDTPLNDFLWESFASNIGTTIIGAICLIIYFRNSNKTKKTLSKYANEMEKIKLDVSSPETIYEKKAKLFLTKDYIINCATGMEIYEYKDIVWLYPHEFRQNGVVTQRSIYIITKDNKAHVIANMSTGKKNNLAFDELYESLLIKAPDALHGYSEENKKKVKELKNSR